MYAQTNEAVSRCANTKAGNRCVIATVEAVNRCMYIRSMYFSFLTDVAKLLTEICTYEGCRAIARSETMDALGIQNLRSYIAQDMRIIVLLPAHSMVNDLECDGSFKQCDAAYQRIPWSTTLNVMPAL